MPWTTLQRLTPRTQDQSASGISHASPPAPTPALLHTRCTAPKASTALRASASTASHLDTSVGTATASAPPRAMASLAWASGSSCTSARTSFIPSRAKRSAIARPMPLAAPVTTATFPFSSRIVPPRVVYALSMQRSMPGSSLAAGFVALALAVAACAETSKSPPSVTAPSASDAVPAPTAAAPPVTASASAPAPVASAAPTATTSAAPPMASAGPGGNTGTTVPAQYRACKGDADCVAVPRAGCCHNGWKEAVATSQKDAYARDFACPAGTRPICPMFIVRDMRVAKCDAAAHLCTMVQP